ncbi:MAG: dihydrodipicolinate reductase [Deltaproteobacteria bacterium]|nr:dihydrodipicolinate reductase [Deltaproteobacteria bacterium]MBW2447314.1 dihydrodipicolinate reductase [Deltaproteobacteria bacterium]
MRLRVIQWATGGVGRAAIEGVLAHPELELVGCWVHSEAKDGKDAGEICGLGPVGVRATRDADALLATDADCVLYSPVMGQEEEVLRILASGKNVVTPLGWFFPFASSDVSKLEAACQKSGVTLHGTGIHPGGITERFPLMVSALTRNVRHVRAEEFSDIRSYAAPFVVREVMLFGKTPEEAAASPMIQILGGGFCQSIDMVAASLGIELDAEKRTNHEMAVATQALDTPVGAIEAGTVAAQRFTWQGTRDGEPVVTVRTNWLMGEEHLDPPWRLDGERFEVEVEGDPSVSMTFHGIHPEVQGAVQNPNPGIVATANHCVNAIPYVCAAGPGIKTYLDLPLVSGRHAAAR